MKAPMRARHVFMLAAGFSILTVSLTAVQAPQGPPRDNAPAPQTKPFVPLAASTVAAHPDAYYGEPVSITATVDRTLSPTAFAMDQDTTKTGAEDVLVLARRLNRALAQNGYVTVLGDLVKFDPARIRAEGYTFDLPSDVAARYTGRPVVLARSVFNSSGVDLAMRLPPPMTAQDEAFQKLMTRIGPAFAALRTGVTESKAEAAKENAAVLAQAFAETEAFWKGRNRPDAAGWAQDARKQSESITKDAAAGNWDDAKRSAGALGQQCQSCHGEYRERFDDGSFRIKTPETPKGQ